MIKYYDVYEINKETNEIENVFGSENRQTIADYLNISISNFSKYIAKSIDNINCKIREDKYFILVDTFEEEL